MVWIDLGQQFQNLASSSCHSPSSWANHPVQTSVIGWNKDTCWNNPPGVSILIKVQWFLFAFFSLYVTDRRGAAVGSAEGRVWFGLLCMACSHWM